MPKTTNKNIKNPVLSVKEIQDAVLGAEVDIYNGQVLPIKKPLGQALTSISEELKKIKLIGNENNDEIKVIRRIAENHSQLLTGIKNRKEFIKSFIRLVEKADKFLKITPIYKVILRLAGVSSFVALMITIIKGCK